MSALENLPLKKIFYFNVIYSCNSCCVFCYSHNTRNIENHNTISFADFVEYLTAQKIAAADRVILNGGEPLLHQSLNDMLKFLSKVGCEVLIYTNGRLLAEKNFPALNKNFRFVIPIHGDKKIHDNATRIKGSFDETLRGLESLTARQNCLTDLKIIVNNEFATKILRGDSLQFLQEIPFNHALQITKMADTVVSKRNRCPSVENSVAAECCAVLVEEFFKRGCPIKIYDTCVKNIGMLRGREIKKYERQITVLFKDKNQFRREHLYRQKKSCMDGCEFRDFCISAVSEYKVLELEGDFLREETE